MLNQLQREIDEQEQRHQRMQSALQSALEDLAMLSDRAVHPRERSRSRDRSWVLSKGKNKGSPVTLFAFCTFSNFERIYSLVYILPGFTYSIVFASLGRIHWVFGGIYRWTNIRAVTHWSKSSCMFPAWQLSWAKVKALSIWSKLGWHLLCLQISFL